MMIMALLVFVLGLCAWDRWIRRFLVWLWFQFNLPFFAVVVSTQLLYILKEWEYINDFSNPESLEGSLYLLKMLQIFYHHSCRINWHYIRDVFANTSVKYKYQLIVISSLHPWSACVRVYAYILWAKDYVIGQTGVKPETSPTRIHRHRLQCGNEEITLLQAELSIATSEEGEIKRHSPQEEGRLFWCRYLPSVTRGKGTACAQLGSSLKRMPCAV